MNQFIEGGYYIKARCIQNSEIAILPPYIREIWDWLLKEANHSEQKVNGLLIERGQLIRTFRDIQEGLHWMIGWRKMSYKKWQCENAMKFLRERSMITTRKTTRGMLITIDKYNYYQDPKNYESNRKADRKATVNKQTTDTINKNDKNVKKESIHTVFSFWKEILNHPKAILSPDRIAKIKDRLKEGHTVEQCKQAILGCKASAYHMGDNNDNKIYDSIDLIFKKGDKLEQFIGYHEQAEKDKLKEVIS